MDDLSDSLKDMQLKKALFNECGDSDEEETLDISKWKTGSSIRRSLSCGNVCDEEFYPSEVGMAMILGDRPQEMQAGKFENVTSCSSWAINSQHYPSQGLAQSAINQKCQELFGNLNNFSESSCFKASTPISEQPFLFRTNSALSMSKGIISKASVEDNQVSFSRRDSSLWPMLLHSATAANTLDVSTISGLEKKQDTRTLEARGITKDPFQTYNGCEGNSNFQSFDFRGYDDSISRISMKDNAQNVYEKGELWIIQPQALTLDASGKGRLLLVNKCSNRNLKFKILFDGKLINVCPQSGILRSKSEIGLRVLVSRCLKENSSEVMEDIIRIICGNIEKRVPVRICKIQKEKSKRDRSFKCF